MTQEPDFDLDAFTPYQLAVAAQLLSETLAREYRERFGISIPEWRVMVNLAHTGGLSVRDIEARAAMEKSKVSRAATRLKQKGLIVKTVNGDDRRLVTLELTDKGRALMAQLLPLARQFQSRIDMALGPGMAAFDAALRHLINTEF